MDQYNQVLLLLLAMGLNENFAKRALNAVGFESVDKVLDWMGLHMHDEGIENPFP